MNYSLSAVVSRGKFEIVRRGLLRRIFILVVTALLARTGSLCQDTVWSGTTVFGIMTKHEIVLGADSRGTPNYAVAGADSMCKVFSPTPNIVFAVTGIARVGNVFDLGCTVAEGCRRAKTYEAVIDTCNWVLRRFLRYFDNVMREHYPKMLDTLVDKTFFEVIYCTTGRNCVQTDAVIYRIQRDRNGRDSILTDRYSNNTRKWSENNVEFIVAGYCENIKSYLDHNVEAARKADRREFVERMIRLEFYPAHPKVGGHVDVVRVSNSGISWMTPYRNCLP